MEIVLESFLFVCLFVFLSLLANAVTAATIEVSVVSPQCSLPC